MEYINTGNHITMTQNKNQGIQFQQFQESTQK
jgi:hypothetical protein